MKERKTRRTLSLGQPLRPRTPQASCLGLGEWWSSATTCLLLLLLLLPSWGATSAQLEPFSNRHRHRCGCRPGACTQSWWSFPAPCAKRLSPHSAVLQSLRAGSATTTTTTTATRPTSDKTLLVPSLSSSTTATTTTTTTSGGSATITNEVFNLIKGIVGVGVLSLPSAIAAFGSTRSAMLPAAVMMIFIGTVSAFGFALIGRVCAYTGATSYRQAWSYTVGPQSSWIPAVSATTKTFLACLAYSMVLKDTFCALLGWSQRTQPVIGAFLSPQMAVLWGITATVLLPLCWLKNLSSLAPFSLLGIAGMVYTGLAMTIRYLDGSYALPAGPLISQLAPHLRPSFADPATAMNPWKAVARPQSLILLCMLSTAYMAHFMAPKFYVELRHATLSRFHTVVTLAFGSSMVLMVAIAALGYLTFGRACDGLVLNNYAAATADPWLAGSRLAVAISLVFSFPLVFQGCRDGVLDLISVPEEQRKRPLVLNVTTLVLLTLITILAGKIANVGFVLAMSGATLGNALTYVYPAMMYRAVVHQQGRQQAESTTVRLATVAACMGIVMGIIGSKMALQKAMMAH